jgi:cell division protein FtsZ
VGEDQNLESSVAVTIIATGFGVDQQNKIVNTEAKKIIHTLEDEQPIEQLLMGERAEIKGFDSPIDLEQNKSIIQNVNKLDEDNSEISNEEVKYNLDSEEISVKPIPQEIFDIPVSSKHITIEKPDEENEEFSILKDQIKNLDVVYDILEVNSAEEELLVEVEEEVTDQDFIINNLSNDVLDLEMVDEVVISADGDSENQFTFDFSLPNENQNKINAKKFIHELNEIDAPDENKEVNEARGFKFEIIEKPEQVESLDLSTDNVKIESESPFDKSIQETAASENEKRKEHLKKFNHSFKHSMSKIDEFEKQPAYKRMGLDLDQSHLSDSNESRLSLDNDKNDEIQLRSNNSFLHDNVD